jgi:hypothetical protein
MVWHHSELATNLQVQSLDSGGGIQELQEFFWFALAVWRGALNCWCWQTTFTFFQWSSLTIEIDLRCIGRICVASSVVVFAPTSVK